MSDNDQPGPSSAPPPEPAPLRPLTKQLVDAILLDARPGNAAVVDFGLDSQEHYEALYYPVRNGEITPAQLEAALGKGPKLTELANSAPSNPHKGIVFRTSWDEMQLEPSPIRDAEAAHEPLESPPQRDAFDAMLADYRGNCSWFFEETDGTHRTWPELSPEGKLGYLARDAALADATPERFAAAALEFLGDLEPAAREAAALGLLLDSYRELHDVARLLPSEDTGHDLLAPARPLADRLGKLLGDLSARKSVLGYDLSEPSPAPEPGRTRGR